MIGFELLVKSDEDNIDAAEVYVEGVIGGRNYQFILDTGSAKTYIQFDDFTSAFKCIKKNSSSGVFAESNADLITVPYIELGPILKRNFTLARSSENSINKHNIIGMDLLKDFRFHFIFDEHRVLVDFSEEIDKYDDLQDLFLGKKHHPYINIFFEKLKVTTVWDTGAGITVVDINFIRKYPSLFKEIGKSIGTDSAGIKMETPIFIMGSSMIGHHNFPPHKVAGADLSYLNSTTEVPMDLILGYTTLSKANWLFDFPQKKWTILKMLNAKNY